MKLDVTASGTPTVSSVTISRTDPDGATRMVRTTDGGPLVLSGGAGTVWDNEIPYGVPVTYSVAEGSAPTVTASMDVAVPWLTHLGVPSRSVAADFRPGTNDSESWAITQGVFPILGRSTPIVITGSARTAPASKLVVGANDAGTRQALKSLLADGSPLLLNVSPTLGLGLATAYISVGNVTPSRLVDLGTSPYWVFELPYQVISRPVGGTRAAVTWADESAKYATWASIPAGTTWAQIAAGG
jgi:hypothetical protein